MRRTAVVAIVSLAASTPLLAQADTCAQFTFKPDSGPTSSVVVSSRDAIMAQLERTYFYPGNGADNLPSLLFEGLINTHFVFRQVPRRVPGPPLLIVLSHRSDVRMRRGPGAESKPVRTPSYSPGGTIFFPGGRKGLRCSATFFQLRHFSNGQEAPAITGGVVNLESGNFSTNFVKLGHSVTVTSSDGFDFLRPALEFHFLQDSLEWADYGHWRFHFQWLRLISQKKKGWASSNATLRQFDLFYHFSDMPIKQRLGASLSYGIRPRFTQDFGIVLNGYVGPDYYNIWFKKQLRTLRLGIVADGGAFVLK